MLKESGPKSSLRTFQRTVLNYYRQAGRSHLPWRKTQDSYKILVSEIMLQQTQVDRVIPYYKRFVKKYPTALALARASLSDVLVHWSGLGYNRRAKYLHDAAKQCVAQFQGRVPVSYEELRSLPGVGDYTAKAVRVFAYNASEVLIETNVRSVIIHHFFSESTDTIAVRGRGVLSYRKIHDDEVRIIAEKAARGQDPRLWHAALMDYGSYLKSQIPNPSRKSTHHVTQSQFEGSLRQVRGAILRAKVTKTPLSHVRKQFPKSFSQALSSLKRDGLV